MQYRTIQALDNQKVGIVGLGAEHLENQSTETVAAVVDAALEGGMNIIDIFMSQPKVREDIGKALKDRRKDVLLQAHFGSCWRDDQLLRTRDMALCKAHFEHYYKALNTDYLDIGMMFFIDSEQDYIDSFETEYLDYMHSLKREGRIRALGASSHNAKTAIKMVESGVLDVLMFSVNPAYDMLPGDYLLDDIFTDKVHKMPFDHMDPERSKLYTLCEKNGVAITTMKTLGGGWLLNGERSPFGASLSVSQCIHYALTRPAVVSALIGCRSVSEVQNALAYLEATEEQKDYTLIAKNFGATLRGKCMYCNHCLPCPVNIDVAAVTKLLDLVRHDRVTDSVRAHYDALPVKASACIECGSCVANCPFEVDVIQNMQQAVSLLEV